MGGTRFIVGALQQILLARSHVARVAFLEAPDAGAAGRADGQTSAAAAAAEAAAGSSGGAAGAEAGAGTGQDSGAATAAAGAHVAGPEFEWSKVEAAVATGPPLQHTSEFHLLAGAGGCGGMRARVGGTRAGFGAGLLAGVCAIWRCRSDCQQESV